MQPHEIAAHRIADALEQIANELAELDPAALSLMLPGLKPWDVPAMADHYRMKAGYIRDTAPIVPLTEQNRHDMAEQVFTELCGGDVYDHVRDHMDRPEWQLRAEWDDRCAWDHDNDN